MKLSVSVLKHALYQYLNNKPSLISQILTGVMTASTMFGVFFYLCFAIIAMVPTPLLKSTAAPMSLGIGYATGAAFALQLAAHFALVVGVATYFAIDLICLSVFGQRVVSVNIETKQGKVTPSVSARDKKMLLSFFDIDLPYKTTLTELECDLYTKLSTHFKNQHNEKSEDFEKKMDVLTHYHAKRLVKSHGELYFYPADVQKVDTPEYTNLGKRSLS